MRPSPDSLLHHQQVVADSTAATDAVDSEVDSRVEWVEVEVDDRSTSPTFVTSCSLPFVASW